MACTLGSLVDSFLAGAFAGVLLVAAIVGIHLLRRKSPKGA